ncbi:VanW family protein [Desulfotruncus alcoholivorax]|uniref:VanW family protein n=1 Tax=Desulfotruncus alcoholivorax TaxID=265477 RepID=UPI0004158C05|nr:VanW family protein [Desulfotruncus alcoholivorax]
MKPAKKKYIVTTVLLLGTALAVWSLVESFPLDQRPGMVREVNTFPLNEPCYLVADKSQLSEKNKPEQGAYDVYKQFKGMDRPYSGPLPWERNVAFRDALEKHKTPVLMAAYKATLPDPIKAEGYNIGLAAQQLAGKVVQPGEVFSQNAAIGPYTEYRGYQAGPTYAGNQLVTTVGGGVCKIASMLYNLATFCDLKIIMRSSHSMTVPYVPPGQDATVYYGVKDLRFLNNTDGPILIWSEKVNDTLYMAFYGQQKPPKVTWHHEVKKCTKYWTQYRYNSSLPPGSEKIIMPGQNGYVVRSWVTVETPDGKIVKKDKGTSWYSASPCIIERGPDQAGYRP